LYGAIIESLEFSRNLVTLKRLNWHTARTNGSVYLSRKPRILRLAPAKSRSMATYGSGFGIYLITLTDSSLMHSVDAVSEMAAALKKLPR